jgi:hypothetical protein
MRRHSVSLASIFLAGAAHAPLLAQAAPPAPEQPPVAQAAAQAPAAEAGQAAEEEDEDLNDGQAEEEIVVTGQRQRGAVDTDIPPEVQLDRRDIRALGASNIAELLTAIAPQTRSGRGRGDGGPVMLLNGRRISGFSEIRDIPPEAIERVDVLPEEVALQYGYRADQRVVNFVLRRRFRAVTAEVAAGMPTAGGRSSYEGDLNVLRISRDGRWSIDAEYRQDSALFESERDIIQAENGTRDPSVPTLAPFRTLVPESQQMTLNGTVSKTIFGDVSATLNGRLEDRTSRSSFGLPSLDLSVPAGSRFSRSPQDETVFRYFPGAGALGRENENRTGHIGVALNGDVRPWRWSFTGNYDINASETRTGTGVETTVLQSAIIAGDAGANPFGDISDALLVARPNDRTNTRNNVGNAELVVNGPLFELPAGEIRTSLRTGYDTRELRSRAERSGVVQLRELSRDRLHAQANLDIPLTSRRRDVLGAIGDFSVNFNAEVERFSDFGTLRTIGAGLHWSPIEQVSFIASVTKEDGAPSMQQLGDPVLLTPNVRVFDFVRGETVDISILSGGNPNLVADDRRVLKLGANIRPLKDKDLNISIDYNDSLIRNPIASFPTATAEIEAAFPERFQRDATGRLLRIETRPVNFARSERRELRWGFNFSKPLGPEGRPGGPGGAGGRRGQAAAPSPAAVQPGQGTPPPQDPGAQPQPGSQGQASAGAPAGQRPPGGWGGRRGPGGGGGGPGGGGFRGGGGFGGGGRGGRLQAAIYHTWRFEDSVLIREGVPELDFLNGSAAGSRGGRPRHELEFQGGVFKDGFGARVTANWQEGTFVRGGAGGTQGDLFFSDFASVNLRLFANLAQQRSLVREVPFLRGSRVALSVDNLFDSRPTVRDDTGATPLSYQPFLLDPLGRTVRISFRKLFF